MPSNPSINDTEALLKLLEQATSQTNSTDSVYNFIIFYNIKSGKQPIKINTLYKLYKHFTKEPLVFSFFKTKINQYFKIKNSNIFINLHNLTIHESILKKLEDKPKIRFGNKSVKSFTQFCCTNNIQSGTMYLSVTVLYQLYKNWKEDKKSNITVKLFKELCKITFKTKLTKKYGLCVGIDKSIYLKINKNILDDLINLIHEKEKKL